MSRVGKHPVEVPSGVDVQLAQRQIKVKGKLGELAMPLSDLVSVAKEGTALSVKPANASQAARTMWGTTRNLIENLVTGVSKGFSKTLEINGVGYRASVQGQTLNLQLGFSHDVLYPIPQGIAIKCEKPTLVVISGADKQRVGQVAAEIRAFRKPEPYKGKGVKYDNETILRKEGKKK